MATSESDDFESADEELSHDTSSKRNYQQQQWSSPTTIGSESDDDTEYVPRTPRTPSSFVQKTERFPSARPAGRTGERTPAKEATNPEEQSKLGEEKKEETVNDVDESSANIPKENEKSPSTQEKSCGSAVEEGIKEKSLPTDDVPATETEHKTDSDVRPTKPRREPRERRVAGTKKPGGAHKLGARRLGTKIPPDNDDAEKEVASKADSDTISSVVTEELTESDMPEEMKSNKKFKEIFKPEGWEGLTDEIPEELIEEKLKPVLERLSLAGKETEGNSGGWGGWGSWGVSSIINTATAGVSTLTSHVTHGLTLLEESIGVPEPIEPDDSKEEEEQELPENDQEVPEEAQPLSTFGFGNFISGVSSITKLVESTGSKVMSGGLDTLEAIGKKTMEVLQEGDPGLKKKRAFFLNEGQKPNLSQVLREAKEKADTAEKSVEEKQRARKIHFESLFDDFQGLVHLEALEMLSKQSNIRMQQHLINLEGSELDSIQETLEEVKELCDLGDENEDTDDQDEKDLKVKLKEACNDLGVNISYTEKVCPVWEESESYLALPMTHSDQEIFEYAVSTLAKFTAISVERFHKTAELILVKERRSTVNEADALVQLTHTLSHQIGVLANTFCDTLNELAKTSERSEDINANITTIFMEATNASSYIQDAFRLLIPIVQVGAI